MIRLTDISAETEAQDNWHRLLQSVSIGDKIDEAEAERHWQSLIAATEGSPSFDRRAALYHWEKLIEGRIIRQTPSSSGANTGSTLRKPWQDTPPPGLKLLYEKGRPTTPGLNEFKVMRLNVKDERGEFNDVRLKMTSSNKSLLSAHMKENVDGTLTVYCCPCVDGAFNVSVTLSGSKFKEDVEVLTFKGDLSILKSEAEMKLACRTISLIRWHLTPGLLVRQGEKIMAGT